MPKRKLARPRLSDVSLSLLQSEDLTGLQPKRSYEEPKFEKGASAVEPSCNKSLPDAEKDVSLLSPVSIHFSQDTISDKFTDGRKLTDTLSSLIKGEITIESIPRITVYELNGTYFTHDNRRLYVFQKYEVHLDEMGEKLLIKVNIGQLDVAGRRRMTTSLKNCGKSVEVIQYRSGSKKGKNVKTPTVQVVWSPPKKMKPKASLNN